MFPTYPIIYMFFIFYEVAHRNTQHTHTVAHQSKSLPAPLPEWGSFSWQWNIRSDSSSLPAFLPGGGNWAPSCFQNCPSSFFFFFFQKIWSCIVFIFENAWVCMRHFYFIFLIQSFPTFGCSLVILLKPYDSKVVRASWSLLNTNL